MKRVDDFMTTPAAGGGWFKIWHDGHRDGEFCVERLRKNGGMMETTIPQDLERYSFPFALLLPCVYLAG
jgi:hypothetical protein